jgi:hypothetical protein
VKLHPFAAGVEHGDVPWRDVEGLPRSDVEGPVLGLECELSPDHVPLMPALAHVVGQPLKERGGVELHVGPPELECDIPCLDPPSLTDHLPAGT